jgi:glycosyltransferase 2 family protein
MAGRAALIAVGVVVSALFAYLAVRHVHAGETWAAFKATQLAWLLPAVALMVLAFYMRAIRWWILYDPSRRPPLGAVIRATFVGYLGNNLLPARAGEAAKTVALNRSAGTPVAETVATILMERVYDVLSLILLLFLMVPALPGVSWLRAAGIVAAVLLVTIAAAAGVLLRYGERPVRTLIRPLERVPFVPRGFVERAPLQFVHGLAGLLRPRVAAAGFLWTTASWIVLGVSYWLVLVAFDLHLSPLAGELVVIGIGLAMILPSSPGAIGVFEAATVVVLKAYGVDNSVALSYALLLHALNVIPLFAVALGAFATRRLRNISVREPIPDVESQTS